MLLTSEGCPELEDQFDGDMTGGFSSESWKLTFEIKETVVGIETGSVLFVWDQTTPIPFKVGDQVKPLFPGWLLGLFPGSLETVHLTEITVTPKTANFRFRF